MQGENDGKLLYFGYDLEGPKLSEIEVTPLGPAN